MKRKNFLNICVGILLFFAEQAWAGEAFIIKNIEVRGLSGISVETVLNYLPVHVGDSFDPDKSAKILRALYKTGFFQEVGIERLGDTLVIQVVERATIGSISVSGNKDIPTDKLNEVLKQMDLEKGRIFQKKRLDELEQALKQEYNSRGKYNAVITIKVTPLTKHRVAIQITISEGRVSRIKEVKIIGNETFSEKELRKQLSLSSIGFLTYFNKKDQYTKEKFNASLEALRSFYLDRGYIKFRIDSTQVLLSPDKKYVYIIIKLSEGGRYYFSGYDLKGLLLLPKDTLESKVAIKKGDPFSRKTVTQAVQGMGEAYGNIGYGFPKIEANPTIDDVKKTVWITFDIKPGQHVYVRRIHFSGNTKTRDDILRRVIKQNEGALLKLSNIKESERQLRLLGYLKNINVETIPVPGTPNQVDLNVNVEEVPSAIATVSVGYGTDGPELNAAYNQQNFMGTGRSVGVNFKTSYWGQSYAATYFNPFYTISGIGRGFTLYYKNVDPDNLDVSTYTSDKVGGMVNYNLPLGNKSSFQFGYGLEHLTIGSIGDPEVTQLLDFTEENGTDFTEVRFSSGWTHNTYDQRPFPTRGVNQQTTTLVALPATSSSLSYYKLGYSLHAYAPAFYHFILTAFGNVNYGNTFDNNGLPFFENYYAGGIAQPGEIRGYENYSVGPKDSNGNALGGNFLANGTLGVILPPPVSRDNLRTMVFVDLGNVYGYSLPEAQQGTDPGPLRYGAGLGVDWRSPFGPLAFSLARPLNEQPDDETSLFQFTISSSF